MVYEAIYANDRRQHRHRCQCCSRIIKVGEPVVMWRLGKLSRALHRECADVIAIDGISHRQLAELHIKDAKAK
jgi:hypothetical protein